MHRLLRPGSWFVAALLAAAIRSAPPAAQDAPGASTSERIGARVVIASNLMAGWQIELDCSRAEWNAAEEAGEESQTLGKRFRFGKDFWASLDTFANLSIGGKEIKTGYWYLAFERSKKGDWFLVVLDPDPIRKKRVDPAKSSETAGGMVIPLKHEKLAPAARQLAVAFLPVIGKPFDWTLEIRFGPHLLTADLNVKM